MRRRIDVLARRVDSMEAHAAADRDRRRDRERRAWMHTVSDADLDFLATLAERVKAGEAWPAIMAGLTADEAERLTELEIDRARAMAGA